VSFKLVLRVVRSGALAGDWQPLDAVSVQQVLVQAGGEMPEDVWPDEKLQRYRALMDTRQRWTLGFLGAEEVVLYRTDFLCLALGYGPNPAALAFLRMMAAEGYTIWTEDGPATDSILDSLALAEARWAAQKKA
jgi:hypothetical protein